MRTERTSHLRTGRNIGQTALPKATAKSCAGFHHQSPPLPRPVVASHREELFWPSGPPSRLRGGGCAQLRNGTSPRRHRQRLLSDVPAKDRSTLIGTGIPASGTRGPLSTQRSGLHNATRPLSSGGLRAGLEPLLVPVLLFTSLLLLIFLGRFR